MSKVAEAKQSAAKSSNSGSSFFEKRGSAPNVETGSSFFSQSSSPVIQTKLAMGKKDDAFEQEADQIADQVQAKLAIGAPDDPYETEADQMWH